MNLFPKITWVKIGQPHLTKSKFYLNLVDQGLVETLGIYKGVETTIMDILTRVDFEVIELKSGSKSYPTLVGHLQRRNMKVNISLDKDKIKDKGRGKEVIISLDPREGKP